MSRTTILFGPPGTGKTTTLLNEVEHALKLGCLPERIAYFAFTRKAASEAVSRAARLFDLRDDDLPWFRTLHSAAFKMLGLSSSEVMHQGHYNELGKALGDYPFEHQYDENTERVPIDGAKGDLALGIYSRARSRMINVYDEWVQSGFQHITWAEAVLFAKGLEDYKQARQLLDFSDFLDEVHEPLPLDLLIIDEAQDLTRQQWEFARRVGARAGRVIIAGDDDQAIFQWAGADLRTFLGMKGTMRVLPISYRLPATIWERAHSISSTISQRQAKQWQPRDDDQGLITHADGPDHVDLRGTESWLLLCRMRHLQKRFEATCRAQGVVYQLNGIWSNDTPDVRAVITYERLRRGEAVSFNRAKALAQYIPGMPEPPKQEELLWNDIKWPFDGIPDWMTAISALGTDEREYIRSLRMNGESLTSAGRVIISTIHGVKGGEADNVLLLPEISRRVEEEMNKGAVGGDAEARVWYVGVTRARHKLIFSQPTTRRSITI